MNLYDGLLTSIVGHVAWLQYLAYRQDRQSRASSAAYKDATFRLNDAQRRLNRLQTEVKAASNLTELHSRTWNTMLTVIEVWVVILSLWTIVQIWRLVKRERKSVPSLREPEDTKAMNSDGGKRDSKGVHSTLKREDGPTEQKPQAAVRSIDKMFGDRDVVESPTSYAANNPVPRRSPTKGTDGSQVGSADSALGVSEVDQNDTPLGKLGQNTERTSSLDRLLNATLGAGAATQTDKT